MIEDKETRDAIEKINKQLDKIMQIPQLKQTAVVSDIIKAVNKITDSVKR